MEPVCYGDRYMMHTSMTELSWKEKKFKISCGLPHLSFNNGRIYNALNFVSLNATYYMFKDEIGRLHRKLSLIHPLLIIPRHSNIQLKAFGFFFHEFTDLWIFSFTTSTVLTKITIIPTIGHSFYQGWYQQQKYSVSKVKKTRLNWHSHWILIIDIDLIFINSRWKERYPQIYLSAT